MLVGSGCVFITAPTIHGSQMSMLLDVPPLAEGGIQGVLADL